MEFAYGTLGLSPEQLAGLTPFQFEIKCRGFKAFRIDEENQFRKLAYIMFCLNADPKASKNVTIDDIWPNANTIKKAEKRNELTKSKVASMMDRFKKNKGLI